MGEDNRGIELYERYTRGYGDAIMLRPAIVANIKKWPNRRHILHIFDATAPVFKDIDGLEIVSISGGSKRAKLIKSAMIRKENYDGDLSNYYQLSDPCAKYETSNCTLEDKPTIARSRQQIFADVVGVDFSIFNYDVSFSNDECDFANRFLDGMKQCIGISIRSIDYWRDYRFSYFKERPLKMWGLVNKIAGGYDGYVITFDHELGYGGKCKNVKSLVEKDIRKVWAVMSAMQIGVGVDSFGVHAFGSVGVPVYGIFGPTDPRIRLQYTDAYWSPEYKLCKDQYCWYKWCDRQPCINSRTANFYWKDIKRQMGGYL